MMIRNFSLLALLLFLIPILYSKPYLDNRLYNLAYSAIVGMEGGKASWGTFTYKIDNKSITLISIMQESKKYGPVITFCLPEEV